MNIRNKNAFFRRLILLLICLAPLMTVAQEQKPAADKGQSPSTTRAQRKKLKKKWKEERRIKRDEKKAVKDHHKRIQTKETRKRMKAERKKGDKLRANKKEPWIVRKFKYRHKH
jgi:hypothetical protein